MADVFTKKKRSEVMSRIRSRGNEETELALVRLLRGNKISGWRRHLKIQVTSDGWRVTGKEKVRAHASSPVTRHVSLSVRPDFVFRGARVAVFVDGCFWHGCPVHATRPRNNRAFWHRKLAGNKARDVRVNRALRRAGWRVVRIWECALRKRPGGCVRKIKKNLGFTIDD